MATTFKFLRWVHEMDGRESRYIKEVLDWYQDEDAGDLKRSELNLKGRSEKSWKK